VLSIGHRHLISGTGPGMAVWLYSSLRGEEIGSQDLANEYLAVFAEFGSIGLLLVGWAISMLALAVFQVLHLRAGRYSASTPSNRYAFTIGVSAALAGALVDGALGCSVRTPANLLTLTVLLAGALTCGLYHHGDPEDKSPKLGEYSLMRLRGIPRYILIGGLAVLLVLFISRLGFSFPADYFAQVGQRHLRELRWGEAQLDYRRACRLDPKSFEHAAGLGNVLAVQATWNPSDQIGLATEALRWYERSLTINPHNSALHVQKARLYQLLGQDQEAATCFHQALMNEPRNPSYLMAQGLFYQERNEVERAHQCFRRAHELDPQHPLPVHQLHRLAELVGPDPAPPSPVAE
jgi:tetratricopeptide (TPR) repeat protein